MVGRWDCSGAHGSMVAWGSAVHLASQRVGWSLAARLRIPLPEPYGVRGRADVAVGSFDAGPLAPRTDRGEVALVARTLMARSPGGGWWVRFAVPPISAPQGAERLRRAHVEQR